MANLHKTIPAFVCEKKSRGVFEENKNAKQKLELFLF